MYRQETHREREAREKPQVKTAAYTPMSPAPMNPQQAQQVLQDSGLGCCVDMFNALGKCVEYVFCCGCCSSTEEEDYN